MALGCVPEEGKLAIIWVTSLSYSSFRFAEQDLYVVLARMIQRFKLEYPRGEKMEQMYHTLLFPDRPVRVQFVERR